jgi:predicted amidophosphoribosyltransferase
VLRFVLPTDCLVCGHRLGRWQHLGACQTCWASLQRLRGPLCSRCGLPAPAGCDLLGPARERCARCLLTPPSVDLVRAVVAYDAVARRLLLTAKLGGRRELLRPLAARMAACLRASGIHDGCTVAAPLPSHPWTDLRRGFSPAGELARRVSRALRLPYRSRLLGRRILAGGTAKRMGARDRAALVRTAFRVRGPVRNERVLLIDDVMTTGASLEACCRLLKAAGAREVRALIWARALPGGGRPAPGRAVVTPH